MQYSSQNSYLNQVSNPTLERRNSLQRLRRQAGLSFFGWLMVLAVAGFAVSVGLKLVPHYLDYNTIVRIVEGVSPEVWRGSSKKKMHETIDKGLKVNNIRTLKSADVLQIDRAQSVTKVNVDYEIRENLFSNLDVVLVFKKDYQY